MYNRFRSLGLAFGRKVRGSSLLSLAFSLLLLSGCNEELLRNLSPEQKRYLLQLYQYYSPSAPLPEWLAAAAAEPEPEPAGQATGPLTASSTQREFTHSLIAGDDRCTALLEGTPRGLACLHCTQPEARAQAEILSLLLFRSCVKNIAINYLVDGTFSYDEELLKEQITLLTTGNRRLFLHFYLSNGPNQRRWRRTEIQSYASDLPPEQFRERILFDPDLQAGFREIVLRLIPVLRFAVERNAVISLSPMLEDNLNDEAFEKLYELTLETVPTDLPVTLVRNPCPSCYDGNTSGAPDGVVMERHTSSRSVQLSNGIISNDGKTYRFRSVSVSDEEGGLTLADLARTRDAAADRNNVFILWKGERQGRDADDAPYELPSRREYEMPDFEERQALIDFLREGLEPEAPRLTPGLTPGLTSGLTPAQTSSPVL